MLNWHFIVIFIKSHRKGVGGEETQTGLVSYLMMFIMRALPVLTVVRSSPAFATPPWRAECLGQENGVRENWVVYIFQQGRKHIFYSIASNTCAAQVVGTGGAHMEARKAGRVGWGQFQLLLQRKLSLVLRTGANGAQGGPAS